MIAFFDTSVIVKLYYHETDSENYLSKINNCTAIYLSEIAKIEFLSAVWKKVRMGDIDESTCKIIVECFENDFDKFEWIPVDASLMQRAAQLLNKYGSVGLRTLDSLQLASALKLKGKINECYTTDNLLNELYNKEI